MNKAQTNVLVYFLYGISLLLFIDVLFYLYIDYSYPLDYTWIQENLNHAKFKFIYDVEMAKVLNVPESIMVTYILDYTTLENEKYMKFLVIGNIAAVTVMVLTTLIQFLLKSLKS